MACRKWVLRGVVLALLGLTAGLAVAYQFYSHPAAVRRQVIDKLRDRFVGANVSMASAKMRILGGIAVSDLRMHRRDDLDRVDFLYVPSGVIYHDKEHLFDGGEVAIRKIELFRPRVRVIRERDGRLNLQGVLGPGNLGERMPTIVIQQGTLVFEDRLACPNAPPLELREVNLTVTNDPLPRLNVEGTGQAEGVGTVQFSARMMRATGETTLTIDVPSAPLGPDLAQRLTDRVGPETAGHLRHLKGTGSVHAGIKYQPGAKPEFTYDVLAQVTKGELTHPRLPVPLEQVEASLRCVNGAVPHVHLTARSGNTLLDATARDLDVKKLLAEGNELPEAAAREIDARVERLNVSGGLFTQMPPCIRDLNRLYSPFGPVSVTYRYRQEDSGTWKRNLLIQPEGMSGVYEYFPYPVERITGAIRVETTSTNRVDAAIDLAGYSGPHPVTLKGTVKGDYYATEVRLDVGGKGLPLDGRALKALKDEKLMALARQFLPDKCRAAIGDFEPVGWADVKSEIRREAGQKQFKNRHVVYVTGAAVKYDAFPFPLENVSGVLEIGPEGWEVRDVRGFHKGGEVRVAARSFEVIQRYRRPIDATPLPPGVRDGDQREQRVQVVVHGSNVLLEDPDFEAALAIRPALQQAFKTLRLAGRLDFSASVVDVPDQPREIDVSVCVNGCRMRPKFFDYDMEQVHANVRYVRDRVYVSDVQLRHGDSLIKLDNGVIFLKPEGGYQVRLDAVRGAPLVPDADFLHALPELLRKSLEPLKLRDPVNVVTALVVDVPADGGRPVVWWDGGLALQNATLTTGVEMSNVTGQVYCTGRHNGQQVESLVGNLSLEQLGVLNQPVGNLHGRFEIRQDSPDVLRLRNLQGELFGGTVAGEGRVEFGSTLRYDLIVKGLGIQLEQVGRHNFANKGEMQGPAMAAVHLTGEGTSLAGLRGNGLVDVPNGKLYQLPPLLDVIKAIGLRVPDRTAFEQAHAKFAIEGPLVRVQELDLYGSAISLRGQGTVNLDGSDVNLDFNADWGRMQQWFPGPVGEVPKAISDGLLKIKMRGDVGHLRYEKEFVPVLTEPLKNALGGPK